MAKESLFALPEICSGCRSCEMWCSWVNAQEFGPNRGRIRIAKDPEGEFDVPVVGCNGSCPHPMEQGVPICVEMCPTGALIYADPEEAYNKRMQLHEARALQPLFKLIAPWKWPYPWRKWHTREV